MSLQEQPTAQTKAELLAPTVQRVKYGVYTVESQTTPGVRWTVVEDANGVLHCSCPRSFFHRGCAHRAAVTVRRAWEAARRPAIAPRAAFTADR